MIFSRLSRSLPRSSRSGNLFNVVGRLAKKNVDEALVRLSGFDSYLGRIDGGLGFLRCNFASIGVHSKFVSRTSLSDVKYILANPNLRRLFSTEPPNKKNCENYCTEEKKEIPKGEEKKTESKDDSSEEEVANAFVYSFAFFHSTFPFGAREQHQISFQEFKNKFLEAGLVDHIVISNNSIAKVFVRSSPLNQTNDEGVLGRQLKYYFDVGSNIEHFKEKLEKAQQALNIDPHDYVPVIYVSENVWFQAFMSISLSFLLLGIYCFMYSRMLGVPGGGGGGGGRGDRGIFNMGNAPIMKVDKNFKIRSFLKPQSKAQLAKEDGISEG